MSVTSVFAHLDEALEGVKRKGIIHVGAHAGQEVPCYKDFRKIVLVEPNPTFWERLEKLGEVKKCAVGTSRNATLYIPEHGTQASLLRPHVEISSTVEVEVKPLSEIQDGCNVAVIDTQGTELDVLCSANLETLDAIIVECSTIARYDDEALANEIDTYLVSQGWTRTSKWPHRWDFLFDAVYQKEPA